VVTILFETGLDGAGRPCGDDLEHSGTSQDHGMLLLVSTGFRTCRDLQGRQYWIAIIFNSNF